MKSNLKWTVLAVAISAAAAAHAGQRDHNPATTVVYDEDVPKDEAILVDMGAEADVNIAKAIRLGHAFIMEFVRRASFHGMTPEHLLRLPSALGASDGGLVFAWREGTTVLGFLQAGVIARGPLGHRVVHLLEADGSIREILGRAKQEALDAFDLEREAVHRSVAA